MSIAEIVAQNAAVRDLVQLVGLVLEHLLQVVCLGKAGLLGQEFGLVHFGSTFALYVV